MKQKIKRPFPPTPQQNTIYASILAIALAMTATAIFSLSKVHLTPGAPTAPFSIDTSIHKPDPLNHRLQELDRYIAENKQSEAFRTQLRMTEVPSDDLVKGYSTATSIHQKLAILQALQFFKFFPRGEKELVRRFINLFFI